MSMKFIGSGKGKSSYRKCAGNFPYKFMFTFRYMYKYNHVLVNWCYSIHNWFWLIVIVLIPGYHLSMHNMTLFSVAYISTFYHLGQ